LDAELRVASRVVLRVLIGDTGCWAVFTALEEFFHFLVAVVSRGRLNSAHMMTRSIVSVKSLLVTKDLVFKHAAVLHFRLVHHQG